MLKLVFNSDNLHIQVFLVTGGSYRSDLDSTEVYDPSVGPSWTARASLPRSLGGLTAANIEDKVLVFGKTLCSWNNICMNNCSIIIFSGGYDGSIFYNTILEYNSAGDEFTEVGTMLEERGFHAISVVKYADYSQHCM